MAAVLVTGGTGFIGGWCIVELLKRGYDVRTTVRGAGKEAAVRAAVKASSAYAEASADRADRVQFTVADLTSDTGWDAAMAGVEFVLHVASPLGNAPGDPIGPARDGTLRVLRAAVAAGVTRVAMTSAAATALPPVGSNAVSDETMWTDPKRFKADPYRLSKVLAERAAWDFMAGKATQFVTVLPGAVFGPVLSKESLGSVGVVAGMLKGVPPAVPKIEMWITDVRDLAAAHVGALEVAEAAGERFIVAGEPMWMTDMAAVLRARLGARGANVPVRTMPTWLVKVMAPFDARVRTIAPLVGRTERRTAAKAKRVLGFAPRPAAETVVDCAESLLAG